MVEWHTVGPYRVSFDVRSDASRFIVVAIDGREWEAKPILVAEGLIEGAGLHPYLLFDSDQQACLQDSVKAEILRLWLAMRDRLRSCP